MSRSYTVIDYRIRPAKYAERLMLCDALRRLRFHSMDDYQYVGLGSIYFSDFRLVHKTLGITKMFSIEKEESDSDRFEWNKPFGGIEMLFGSTEQRLCDIDFSKPTIIWLDYDGRLTSSILSDIRLVARSASHGSVLILTVNADLRENPGDGLEVVERLRNELGTERVPSHVKSNDLYGWKLADLYRDVAESELLDALSNANGVKGEAELVYQQIFNFHYRDGARMATFGGIFCDKRKLNQIEDCAFARVEYLRKSSEAFLIGSPKLTYREINHIERQLPLQSGVTLECAHIPKTDAEAYAALYRFLPSFLSADIV